VRDTEVTATSTNGVAVDASPSAPGASICTDAAGGLFAITHEYFNSK